MRFLDYQKVKQAEREKANALFGTEKEPTELALKVIFSLLATLPVAGQKKKKITMMLTFVAGTDHGHQILDFQRVDI